MLYYERLRKVVQLLFPRLQSLQLSVSSIDFWRKEGFAYLAEKRNLYRINKRIMWRTSRERSSSKRANSFCTVEEMVASSRDVWCNELSIYDENFSSLCRQEG